jgi:hypothetical protein
MNENVANSRSSGDNLRKIILIRGIAAAGCGPGDLKDAKKGQPGRSV